MTQPNPSSPLWPTDWQGCRIQAQYLDLGGVPISGTVTFTATPTAMLDFANKQIVVPKVFSTVLDVNGKLDIVVPATDDPDINPNGWTYAVSENFTGGRKYNIEAPQNTTIDLSQVSPVPNAAGIPIVRGPRGAAGGIQSIQGHTEQYITTLSAADVGADPLGAATSAQSAAIAVSLQKSANLSDLSNLTTARNNLGLQTAVAPTANTIALRDSNGRSQVAYPSDSADIANKSYADFIGIPKSSTGSSGYPTSYGVGSYVDDSVLGLLRWSGSAWQGYSNTVDGGNSGYIRIGSVLFAWGQVSVTLSNAATGAGTVTFPVAYSTAPKVSATPTGATSYYTYLGAVTTSTAPVGLAHRDGTTSSGTFVVHWHAIGLA